MKAVKFFFVFLFTGLFALASVGCKKCKGEDPRARITNNGTQKASVQIKTSNGNTININNVEPGTSSEYSNYAAGQVTFTITVDATDYVKTENIDNCHEYEISIGKGNGIVVVGTDRNN